MNQENNKLTIDLDNCPFCDNKPMVMEDAISDSPTKGMFRIYLGALKFDFHDPKNRCPLYGQFGNWHTTRKGAINEWNTRSQQKEPDNEARRALKDCLEFISQTDEFKSWNSLTTPDWFVKAALIEAELQPQPLAVPEGWPTEKMVTAGENCLSATKANTTGVLTRADLIGIFRAMYQAQPKTCSNQGGE